MSGQTRATAPVRKWSVVRMVNRYGWETWAIFRSDALYLGSSGHWVRPIDAAEFGTESEALEFGREHAPEQEYHRGQP